VNIFRGLMIVVAFAALSACKDPNASSDSSNDSTASPSAPPSASVKPLCDAPPAAAAGLTDVGVTDLKIEDVSVGTGAEATVGKTVVVNYIGRLANGTQFDASCDRKQPFDFPLGAGAVIKGWDQGVAGMKVGGQRRLIIPSSLGYGAQGAGGVIPPNAALVFDVELVEVK
jgi:FKBP-type peptidyl-prolyl cis-trans isomerase FkpA